MAPNPISRFSTLTSLESPTRYEILSSISSMAENSQESPESSTQKSIQIAALNNPHKNIKFVSIVGGVLGSLALLGLLGLLLRVLHRGRSGTRMRPSLTARRTESFHESPTFIPTPPGPHGNLKAGFHTLGNLGAKLGLRSSGSRKTTSKMRHHRENSQVFYRRFPQHSRDGSSMSNYAPSPTFVDKTDDWFMGVNGNGGSTHALPCRRSRDFVDHCEKQAHLGYRLDVPQFLNVDDHKVQLDIERVQESVGGNRNSITDVPGFDDYFSYSARDVHDQNYYAPIGIENMTPPNPFTLPRPQPATPKTMTYIADIRRSRGRSIEFPNHFQEDNDTNSLNGVSCRYPSTIAPIRDSYRDSICSVASSTTNERRYKRRSDPFDLDRPELWLPQSRDDSAMAFQPQRRPSGLKYIPDIYPGGKSRPLRRGSVEKNHANEVFLMDWGDPGPDIGSARYPVKFDQGFMQEASRNPGRSNDLA
ncbi:hypothetical protein K3495_g668 [Podosphaera aphanis]|nr:hypothetical protein K3495_g668 [Podosphaera aphanis]